MSRCRALPPRSGSKPSSNSSAPLLPALSQPQIFTTKAALETALRSNLLLQSGILDRLGRIASLKVWNRRAARDASVSLRRRWYGAGGTAAVAAAAEAAEGGTTAAFQPLDTKVLKKLIARERRRREREMLLAESSDSDGDGLGGNGRSGEEYRTALPTAARMERRWAYNEDRRWTRRFFVDPDRSVPGPNEDLARRREKEAGVPTLRQCPPWSKDDLERLGEATEETRREQIHEEWQDCEGAKGVGENNLRESATLIDDNIGFDKVASLVNRGEPTKGTEKVSRSATECRAKYLTTASPSINNSKLTKCDSSKVDEQTRENGGFPPDWDTVAASLGGPDGRRRTPWQCFRSRRSRLDSSTEGGRLWTPEEDELLLKCVAAHGPGFLFTAAGGAADVVTRLLPDRNPMQVYLRAHLSLLNPKYKNEAWTGEEERRLALCMRVYSDARAPFTKASAHFPDRASKSVFEKWTRTLDPEITFKSFTKKEDRKLLDAVENVGGANSCSWAQVTRQHFPTRNPRSVKFRWMELASEKDLIIYERKPNQCTAAIPKKKLSLE